MVLWVVGCLAIVVVPLALPEWQAARFFSSFQGPGAGFDFMELYVPVNPFSSLAKGIVPAIVVFALSVGAALAAIPGHEDLLRHLDVLGDAVGRVTSYLTRWMPIGVFVMTAGAAGTMTIDELGRLQGYLAIYVVAVGLLVWCVLPAMVAAVTPFGHREVLSASREALITAFATGKLFVVLPLLIEGAREIFERRGLDGEEAKARASILVPLGYAFPHLGKLMVLLFLPFAGWYVGAPLDAAGNAKLLGAGIASSFGSPLMSVPFLLDLLRLPDDVFQLFVVSGVLTTRFGDMLGAASLITLTILATIWSSGRLVVSSGRLLRAGVLIVVVSAGAILGTRALLSWSLAGDDGLREAVRQMQLTRPPLRSYERLAVSEPNPVPFAPGETPLQRVRRRGILRVGYVVGAPPFSFENDAGELVGFDVEMAHDLADAMAVDLEFVPVERSRELQSLLEDHCDVLMGGVIGRMDLVWKVPLTRSVLDATLAFVVRDHVDREDLADLEDLRIFTPLGERTPERVLRYFPKAEVVPLENTIDFFVVPGTGSRSGGAPVWQERRQDDVLMCPAEEGATYTIFRPDYQVINPLPRPLELPIVYAVAPGGEPIRDVLDHWIELQGRTGRLDELRQHWVHGQGATVAGRRWSLVRDVLGWID